MIHSIVLEYCRGLGCVPWGLGSLEVLCVSEACLMAILDVCLPSDMAPALGRACPCWHGV